MPVLEVEPLTEDIEPQHKICPLRAIAYTIAGVPNKVQEPLCIGQRCAWFIPEDEGLGVCVLKRLAWP
ncbi:MULTISPECIES: hypothetical protein [unclassified Archaeoglobus]|jgi:hypothetical protein|uniref:hypothetical protein n=1 Tax=unclassified Archaeoglobus TaxID=2643606 RepID=UPI0025BE5C08|nr:MULTISPECIES: hypothetical protein [unclassified Archaeoglobus]